MSKIPHEAIEILREALIQADLLIRSFPGTDQSNVEFIRKALNRAYSARGLFDNENTGREFSEAIEARAYALARNIWGYFKGGSAGGSEAMQWFDNHSSLGGPAHIIEMCKSTLTLATADAARAQGAEVVDLQEYVAQLHQSYVIEEYCVRPNCNDGKPFWAAFDYGPVGGPCFFSEEKALEGISELRGHHPSREFRVISHRSEPVTIPPAPQPMDREKVLEEALKDLEGACEQLAATRSIEIYSAMIDGGQAEALLSLDGRRRAARAALKGGEA